MGTRMASIAAAVVVATAPLFSPSAQAQFGLYSLPKDNFIWNWGQTREGKRRGFADLQLSGGESSFKCDLTASLRAASGLSPDRVRQIEMDLRARLDFIYAASEAMNYLEQTGGLNWATLDCKHPEPGPVDESEQAERASQARAKMQREVERRRARQQRDDAAE